MDYNKLLNIGEVFKAKYKVEVSDTADFHGNTGVRVLSTPALLRYVEQGSSTGVYDRLSDGYRPVGTYVELHHVSATPVGGIIEIVSEVSEIEGRKFTYNFKAFHQDKIIAYGVYGQTIVPLDDFLKKSNVI
ncbi:thioesterase family protein [Gudongella sp. DL1XJH-153]|uniref:thioesterase family protein n=1 Tax=Gudongella sp. DL1XJH-153 TaxID=3409804 RepID=UPI003BB64FA9